MKSRQIRRTGGLSAALERKYGLDPIRTGRITENLFVVNTDTVDFYIYRDGDNIICFDSGYRPLIIRRELRSLELDPDSATHVFLSHADIDHSAGLRVFKNATIYLSADEERMIRGARSIREAVRSPRIRRAYELLGDDEVVTIGSHRVRAIATPGHTPGSMAYLMDDTYLFLGDTCKLRNGQAYAGKHYTMDYETQKESIRKLAQLQNVGWVFTAHSGYTRDFCRAFDYWK